MGPPGARLALFRMQREVLSPPSPALGPEVAFEGSCPRAGYEAPGWTHPPTPDAGLRMVDWASVSEPVLVDPEVI